MNGGPISVEDAAVVARSPRVGRTPQFIKPAFGYYGSKHRLATRIVALLPPHNAWVEAFCGSASVTLNKKPVPIEIINDLDDHIFNLFRVLREQPAELCRAIELTPYARSEFELARSGEVVTDALEKARRFLVATMMTVNGTSGSAFSGFSFSDSYARSGREARVNRWYQLPTRLQPVVERLRSVRVENKDARDLIAQHSKRPGSLVYLDPPYLMDRRHQYTKDANNEVFHEALLKLCNKAHCMVLISGYKNELYGDHLTRKSGWTMVRLDTTTRGVGGEDIDRTEVLWINDVLRETQKANRVLIDFTGRERRIKKINPERSKSPLKSASAARAKKALKRKASRLALSRRRGAKK